jgi:hypothetical protein
VFILKKKNMKNLGKKLQKKLKRYLNSIIN